LCRLLDRLAQEKDDIISAPKLNYTRFWKITRIGSIVFTIYMMMNSIQRWLRKEFSLVGHLLCKHRPDLALLTGGCYELLSHVVSPAYVGGGQDFPK
jgi:hypothetical protein